MTDNYGRYNSTFLEEAHRASIFHKSEIMNTDLCGCFHCQQTFLPAAIKDWIDEGYGKEETAWCPYCGIDTVLSSAYPIRDPQFLKAMNRRWFS